MAENTKLTRPQYIKIANQWIKDNPKEWQKIRSNNKHPYTKLQGILEKEHGKPHWRDQPGRNKITGSLPTKKDPGIGFRMYPTSKDSNGNQQVSFKSDPTRAATRGQATGISSGTRKYLEHAASPPGANFKDADRAMAEARATGPDMDGGHKIPLNRQVAGQEYKVQTGRGTVQQYQDNFAKSGQAVGHQRANIEPQPAKANRVLQRQAYSKLDKALKALDDFYAQGKAFKMGKTALRGHIVGYLPEALEIADHYTNGAVSNEIEYAGKVVANEVEYVAKDVGRRLGNAWNGAVNAVNGSNGDYGHDYGQ